MPSASLAEGYCWLNAPMDRLMSTEAAGNGRSRREGVTVIKSRHLQAIPRTHLTEEIIKRLVRLILEKGLKPGDKLPSERELISLFSVGRSSLREAVKILSALGVVEVSVGAGMFVGRGDLSLVTQPLTLGLLIGDYSRNELIETRRVIEVSLAGLAAERASEEEVKAIAERLEAMRESHGNPARYSRADFEFHLAIARAAHNGLLYNMLHNLRDILRALITGAVTYYDADHMPQSTKVHDPIYEAIRARDPKAARQAMAVHLDRLEERLSVVISKSQSERFLGAIWGDGVRTAAQRSPRPARTSRRA